MEKVQSNIICMTAQEHELVHRSADILKGKIKEPNTLFRRLVRFHRWEIFKIPGKWLYRVGMVVPADLPWHPGYTVYATKGLIKGKPNAKKLADRLNMHIEAAKKEAERA